MLKELKPAALMLILLTVLTGALYPALITGLAQALFPGKANGSLIRQDGKIVGSSLIGQPFSDPAHFWGRPSATGPMPDNAAASSGSNLGPLNPALKDAVVARIDALKAADPTQTAPIPVDLVTASGSGLDARIRGLSEAEVSKLIDAHTEGRQLGLLGEPRVNVLTLNLALDRLGKP